MYGKYLRLKRYLPPMILATVAVLVVLRQLYDKNIQFIGNDIMLHINPVWLLQKQWREGVQWPYWGSWDSYRYCGFPFLTAYAPLFYYGASFLSILFNVSASEGTKWLVILTFPFSAVAMYYCSKSILRDELASMVSGLAYVLVPIRLTQIMVVGNPTYSLVFVFIPFIFLFCNRLSQEDSIRYEDLVFASLSLSVVILSHHGVGISLFFFLFLFFVLKWLFSKKVKGFCLLIFPLTVAVSAFFLIPMVTYYLKYPFISFPLTPPASPPLHELFILYFSPYGWTPLGATAFTSGLIAPLFIKKNSEFKLYLSLAWIILGAYALSVPHSLILPIGVIGGRSQWLLAFFVPLLIGFFIASIKRNALKQRVKPAAIIVTLLFLEALLVPIYYPPSPTRYINAYEYIRNDPQNFATLRVWQVPRSHLVAALPIYTSRGTIDGVTFGPKELDYFIFKSIANAGGDGLIGHGWGDLVNNADRTLKVLGTFGVKYLIVDSGDPVYPVNISRTIYSNIKYSELVEEGANFTDPRYPENGEPIHVFELKDWSPIIVATKAFIVEDEDEAAKFYEIVSSKDFDPKTGIFLSKDNSLKGIPHAFWNRSISGGDTVESKLDRLEQFETGIKIEVKIDEPCFLYIPMNFYNPGLKFMINERSVEPLKALPNFIAFYLPMKGTYKISIFRQLSLIENASLTVSLVTIGLLVLLLLPDKIWILKNIISKNAKDSGNLGKEAFNDKTTKDIEELTSTEQE